MNKMRATIIGSTGLIGSHLRRLLEEDLQFESIRLMVRRPVAVSDPRTSLLTTDFSDPSSIRAGIEGSDVLFCTVGTTNRNVKGDKIAYRKVDYDIPVQAARMCEETGCGQLLLVSSVGASSRSRVFYSRLKGEAEEAVRQMNISSVSVFRPSLLLGKRSEFRFGERIAQWLMGPLAFAIPSPYTPIRAEEVARAMVAASKKAVPGYRIYHHRELMRLIQS
jgi:uncharacterized protein YbjT (DUF2867 family)